VSAPPPPPARSASTRGQALLNWLFYGPLGALQFLTIAPPIVRRPFTVAELGVAVGFFPLVGLLVGELLAALDWGLARVFPPALSAALVLAAWVGASGALHLDGFLDACDGLFGGHTPEARLRIMRDERVGAFGLVGGVLLLLTQAAALASLSARAGPLILAPVVARWAMALAVIAFPYARAEGLGRAMKEAAGWPQAVLASATALAAGWLVAGLWGLAALALAGAVAWLVARWVLRRLPGLTGDVYGALCQVIEVLVLLFFALLQHVRP
jgi:adenosylcobinamide-GDP ribazoletransferase